MQKTTFTLLLISTLLLSACGAPTAVAPAPATPTATPTAPAAAHPLTDDEFVTLTAQYLCLNKTQPNATPEEQGKAVQGIFDKAGVSQEEYAAYNKTLMEDTKKKDQLGLAVVGQMNATCDFGAKVEGTGAGS